MAVGYRLFAFWMARAGLNIRAISGNRKAVITQIYRPVASITNFY